jgi:hypothetical protein
MWLRGLKIIDWFVPEAAKSELSELNLARNFVFTHLAGPTLSQSISVFLYQSDPHPGIACWTVIIGIWLFLALPFVFKWTGNLQLSALISVELLAFASLFGAYQYGGVSSPFLPWFIVSLLLGFFYLLFVRSSEAGDSDLRWQHIGILRGLRLQWLSRARPYRAANYGGMGVDPVGDYLHVLDGDLLRQYDLSAVGTRT